MGAFLVLLEGKDRQRLTDHLLNEHINFLKQLKKEGRLVICGPFVETEQALLVIKADSLLVVEQLIKQDPFIRDRYYQQFSIQEFVEANEENNWLKP